jgi:hypothetical protein
MNGWLRPSNVRNTRWHYFQYSPLAFFHQPVVLTSLCHEWRIDQQPLLSDYEMHASNNVTCQTCEKRRVRNALRRLRLGT